MKLSEELRLRNIEVEDIYAFTRNGDAYPYTYRVDNPKFLQNLLSGLYDEEENFLWVVDKNGIKKEKAES